MTLRRSPNGIHAPWSLRIGRRKPSMMLHYSTLSVTIDAAHPARRNAPISLFPEELGPIVYMILSHRRHGSFDLRITPTTVFIPVKGSSRKRPGGPDVRAGLPGLEKRKPSNAIQAISDGFTDAWYRSDASDVFMRCAAELNNLHVTASDPGAG